jgi:GNAT superfamily N-acetyltransferase
MSHLSGRATWVVRASEQDDTPGISDLFQIVYGRPVPQGHWDWKLHSLPTTTEHEWVAESDGRIVGHYAVIPTRFKLRDRQALIPHGCDAMTHPEYRRQGILTALGQRANEIWARAGSPFQIGFHYGGWGSLRASLGWQPVVRLVWTKRWLRPFAGLARQFQLQGTAIWRSLDSVFQRYTEQKEGMIRGNSDSSGIRVLRVLEADERFDRLWKGTSPEYDILAIRDRLFVQLRCLDRPGADQRLFLAERANEPLGYIALRITQTEAAVRATILDCFVAPGDRLTAHALLHHAVDAAAESGARSISALVAPESRLSEQLTTAGFHAGRHGYDFSLIPYSSSIPSSTAAGWFLTGAEGDVI